MKTKLNNILSRPKKSLRRKLLAAFVIFGIILLALLWSMQTVFFEDYYKISMKKKCSSSVKTISRLYAEQERLSYEDFCDALGRVASANDIYFYVEAYDGSFSISSTEQAASGITFSDNRKLVSDAKRMLLSSAGGEVNFTLPQENGGSLFVQAKLAESKYRNPVLLFATVSLIPLGPAVSIMRSQLLVVTAVVLVLGSVIAYITSRKLATPIQNMSKEARKLEDGNFDVSFEGADYPEINELADTLNSAAQNLKKTDELQKDLMANVSHDIRTPLTMIKSYAEMIRDISGENKEKREAHLGVIIDETDRLTELVQSMLELSKVQSGNIELDKKDFSLVEACEEIFNTYKVVETDGFEMIFEAPADDPLMVFGDENRIKQVISNLISNAIKYSDEHKYVRVFFESIGDYARLHVLDKGVGISEEDCQQIWNRYTRASQRNARSKEGTGLGLSICSELIKLHKGRYGVESTLGEGSDFWFEIKRSQ